VPTKFRLYTLTGSLGVGSGIRVADLDGDTMPDIYVGKYGSDQSIWEWNGSTFVGKVLAGSNVRKYDVQFADINRNGKQEIILAGNGDLEKIYEWDGTSYTKLKTLVNPPAKIFYKTI
jgi:hypothetical protein